MSYITYYDPNNVKVASSTFPPGSVVPAIDFFNRVEEVVNSPLSEQVEGSILKPDGGPAEYYDLPPNPKTLNDLLEYKGDKHWLGDSFHLSNIVKAAWRWGIKSGVDKAYDARKFIYSGVRLLLKYQGLEETRATLQKMLDDPQFGGVK